MGVAPGTKLHDAVSLRTIKVIRRRDGNGCDY